MDVQTSGMLPAHTFALFLVFFLQQHGPNPILPCIHDQLKDKGAEVYESKCRTSQNNIGVSRICTSFSAPGWTISSMVFKELVDVFRHSWSLKNFNEKFSTLKLIFGFKITGPTDFLTSFKASTTKNPSSAGQLWIDFLNFFSFKFLYTKKVVSVRRIGGIPKEETKWQNKKLVIEGKE